MRGKVARRLTPPPGYIRNSAGLETRKSRTDQLAVATDCYGAREVSMCLFVNRPRSRAGCVCDTYDTYFTDFFVVPKAHLSQDNIPHPSAAQEVPSTRTGKEVDGRGRKQGVHDNRPWALVCINMSAGKEA